MSHVFYGLLGVTFTLSHVLNISFGMNIKPPEMIIGLLILARTVRIDLGFLSRNTIHLFLLLFFAFLIFPIFSNLRSIDILDQLFAGAAALGFESQRGRYHPVFAPWVMWVWNMFSFLSFFCLAQSKEAQFVTFRKWLLPSVLIMNLYGLYHTVGVNFRGLPDVPWLGNTRHEYFGHLRAQSFMIEPLNLAHFFIYIFPLFFIHPYGFKRLYRLVIIWFNLGLSSIIFILTFSTSGLVSLVFGYSAILFLAKPNKLVHFFHACILTTAGYAVLYSIPQTRSNFIEKITFIFSSPITVGPTFWERSARNNSALNVFLDHPVLGVGLGNSGFLFPQYAPTNMAAVEKPLAYGEEYIRLLAEVGLLGTLVFLLFIVAYLRYLLKNQALMSTSELLCFGGGFLATLMASNFSFFMNVYFVWIFAGFSIALIESRRQAVL